MAPLKHPNLVRLYGAVWNEGPDKLCIVLEYVSGGSLFELLAPAQEATVDTPFDADAWASSRFGLAYGIAKCFNYLHQGQISTQASNVPVLHRDLKPANVLIDSEMHAKVRYTCFLLTAVCSATAVLRLHISSQTSPRLPTSERRGTGSESRATEVKEHLLSEPL